MEWKHNFENIILDRGKEYFESGLVEDIEIDTDEITALVIGSDEYEVTIELDKLLLFLKILLHTILQIP